MLSGALAIVPSPSPLLLLLLPCVGMVGGGSLVPFWWKGISSAGMLSGNGRPCVAAASRQWSLMARPESWVRSRYGQVPAGGSP